MSMPRSGDHFFSQKRFARLPKIGAVQAVRQPRGSLDSASHHSAVSSNHDLRIEEGDLVTGIVDIAYERAHMMSAFRGQSKPRGVHWILEHHTEGVSSSLEFES